MKAISVILTSGVGARLRPSFSIGHVPLRLNKVGACAGTHVSAFAKVGAHSCAEKKLSAILYGVATCVGAHSCAPLQLNEVPAA